MGKLSSTHTKKIKQMIEDGYYNGIEYTPPKWKAKPTPIGKKKGRVIKVVYPIERTNGEVEYWSADRADLQPIIFETYRTKSIKFCKSKQGEI